MLFINAAEDFANGKRQSQLHPEQIDRIVTTYRHRTEAARYSRRVSMYEIEQRGFNLNIFRYVSNAVAEEEVDLTSVHARLVEIEKEITSARHSYNEFLRELGLPPLPRGGVIGIHVEQREAADGTMSAREAS